jgi:eukaryotic-like serine/threonine-protein kinase
MAEVWIARLRGKRGFAKLVAIKTILSQHAGDPQFQSAFLNEARLVASIEHPNVAEILDLGEERDLLFFVLEFVEGDSLSALWRVVRSSKQRFPLNIALRIASDVCAGLEAAHQLTDEDGRKLGVVHRDVSPSNILVSLAGVSKLIDFGVAKAIHRLGEPTASGIIKGKISYMAPEQASGTAVDHRADIWAVGAVLHHLLAGKPPYVGENQLQVLNQLVNGREPPPLPGVPAEVSATISRALRRDPSFRFSSAAEMQRALEEVLVKSCGATTSADVALFARTALGERVRARQDKIRRAVEGADAQARLAAEMASSVEQQSRSDLAAPSSMASPQALTPPPLESAHGQSVVPVTPAGGRRRGRLAVMALLGTGAAAVAGLVLFSQQRMSNAAAIESPAASALPAASLDAPAPEPAAAASSAAGDEPNARVEPPPSPSATVAAPAPRRPQQPVKKQPPRVLEVFGERR